MEENKHKISVCLVVYNEGKVIERCLESIRGLADEIILLHDGDCADDTLEIAKKYTDKIFIRPHTGESSLHRVFTYNQAKMEWILQIDADEYIDRADHDKIRELIAKADNTDINGYSFKWEMWDGERAFNVRGFQKDCLFRREHYHYLAITHGWAYIDGRTVHSGLTLHHRPAYNNICWKSFFRKAKRWVPIHAGFYFPETAHYDSYNIDPQKWISFTEKVRKNILFYLFWEPIKMSLGQLRNGLYTSWAGWQVSAQQYVYYFSLYWQVWKMNRKLKSH